MTSEFKFNGFNEASYWNGQYGALPWLNSLQSAKDVGANTIAITSTSYLANTKASTIYSTQQTESLANVAKAVLDAKANGLTAILKPHIDLADHNWRGRLDPADPAAFFKNYKDWIVDYAKVAEANGADMLVIGVELDQLASSKYHGQWADIVASIRSVYKGDLTYAANCDANTGIWDLVDYIGVNPYVPLSTNSAATKADFVKAWNSVPSDPFYAKLFGNMSPLEHYKKMSETYDKPMLMTELGYRSMNGTAAKPMDFSTGGTVDQKEQAALFDALFEVFAPQASWMKGTLIWGWSTDRAALETKSNWATGYSIEGKAAEAIIDKWYGGEVPNKDAQTVDLTLKLAADIAGGPAVAAVVVDRQVVGTISVGNVLTHKGVGFKDYHLSVPMTKNADGSPHTVEIYFLNPAGGRALHVDAISLGGTRYEAEAAGSTKPFVTVYSKGTVTKISVSDGFLPPAKPVTEPLRAEQVKTEPAKTEPAKVEPVKAEPAKPEPAKAEPAKPEPAKAEPAKPEPVKAEPPAATPPAATPTVPVPPVAAPEPPIVTPSVKLVGTAGRDVLSTDALGAAIAAGAGDDTINLSKAPASIDGGAGNDRVAINGNVSFAVDSVQNVEKVMVRGAHTVDLSALKTGLDITLEKAGATVSGTQGKDWITGAGGGTIRAGAGDDSIVSKGVGDSVFAGDGNDHLMFYAQQTKVDGGAGNDLATLWGQHTVTDAGYSNVERFCVADEARLDFSGMTGNLSIIGAGNATKGKVVIGGAGNDTMRLMGGDDKASGGAGNDMLYGDGGNDTLAGGRGTDQLAGGAGRDTFVFGARDADRATDTVDDFKRGEDKLFFDGFAPGHLRHVDTAKGVAITANNGAGGQVDVLVKGVTWAQIESAILYA